MRDYYQYFIGRLRFPLVFFKQCYRPSLSQRLQSSTEFQTDKIRPEVKIADR